MLRTGLNFDRRLWAACTAWMALTLSAPAFAQPVGEATGSGNEAGVFAELGNLAQIAGALNATLVQQNQARSASAGGAAVVVVAPVGGGSGVADKNSADKIVAKTDGDTVRKGATESTRTGGPATSMSSLPSLISAREMPDLALAPSDSSKNVNRSPGMSSAGGAGSSMTSMPEALAIGGGGSRGPAVLAKSDPTLRALSKSFNAAAEQKENLAVAQANQDALAELFKAAKKRKDPKNDKASKAEEMAQKMFEESISDLMAREAPYEEKDYQDFRDFIAEQKDRLGETDTTATDFRAKAKEAFEMFHKTDESAQTMARKEAYRRFISTEMTEETQILVPTPHADPMGSFGTTTH